MPFARVYGVPTSVPKRVLIELRRELVEMISDKMIVKPSWVRVFIVPDMLDAPMEPEDGAKTIFVSLDTAMFTPELLEANPELPGEVIAGISQTIWWKLGRKFEVEGFVCSLHPEWKDLIKAATE